MHSREVVCGLKLKDLSEGLGFQPILSFHDFRHSKCFGIQCWRGAEVPPPVRVSILNDPLLLYTAPSCWSPAGGTQVGKNKLPFSAHQAGRLFVIVHFGKAFLLWVWGFFLFGFGFLGYSFCRAYITVSWSTNGHEHKHHLQGCSTKLRQIVLKLAWVISENCQWLADYGLNWSQIATKSHKKSSTDIF